MKIIEWIENNKVVQVIAGLSVIVYFAIKWSVEVITSPFKN